MTTSALRSSRSPGGFRHQCAICSLWVVTTLLATAAQAGAGEPVVDVTIVQQTPNRIVLHYAFGDVSETVIPIGGVGYSQIGLANESQILEAGAPDLPRVCRSIIIPNGVEVTINVVSAQHYGVSDIDLAPSKGNLFRTVNPDDMPYVFGKAYQTDADYPGKLVALREPYVLRDYRGVVVELYPFQYNPVTRRLRVYTEMTVEVLSSGLGREDAAAGLRTGPLDVRERRAPEKALSRAFHQLYERHFLNYPAGTRYPPLDEAGEMLIICHDPWLPNVQPLADHKNAIGITTTLVGVSTIGNNPTAIKNHIQSLYDSSDLAFVLLVGDAAEVESPQVTVGSETESADPTYALLAGGDQYPDILVGRFSAQTPAQVDTQVLRTIEYETMPATEQPWFKRGIGIGSAEGQGIGDDGESDREHIENIRTDLLGYGYTLVDQIYDPGATAQQVSNALNAGRGIVNYCGHGSVYSWGTTGFDTGDVNALINDNMLPFIVTVACNNGTFDGYTCLAEAWMRATNGAEPTGAIGIYASSVSQYWAPPMCAQDESVDLLVAEAYVSFGTLCFAGSCQMIDEYGFPGFEMFETWHVFGDPSLRVYGRAEPPTGLWVTGDNLYARGKKGGPFTPDSTVYTLHNVRETPIDYEVSASVSWVDITNAGGTLPGLGTAEATVSLNQEANTLEHGLHEGTIYFVNTTDHDGDTERPVSVEVDARTLLYEFPMDSDPGWSTQGQWAFGQPTGGGSHDRDPTAGHTGTNVYGYNLYGDYTNYMPAYYLTTTALDCSAASFVELHFWRWLGVESSRWDHATVDVSNDGTHWTRLWENPTSSISDSSWSEMVFDISAVADGEPTVYVRWAMGPTDGSVTYPGWNVDDVEIRAVSQEPLVGDLDGDGDVDLADLAILLASYGLCEGDPGFNPIADLDDSGCVDLIDLSLLLANYGIGT